MVTSKTSDAKFVQNFREVCFTANPDGTADFFTLKTKTPHGKEHLKENQNKVDPKHIIWGYAIFPENGTQNELDFAQMKEIVVPSSPSKAPARERVAPIRVAIPMHFRRAGGGAVLDTGDDV